MDSRALLRMGIGLGFYMGLIVGDLLESSIEYMSFGLARNIDRSLYGSFQKYGPHS